MFKEKHKKVGGRKRGTPNKVTASAKEAFEHAFEAIGGAAALAAWAKKHQTMFYRLYARLVPLNVNVDKTIHMLSYAEERAREQQGEQPAAPGVAPKSPVH